MKLFRYIFVTLILLSVIGCYQSLNAGSNSEASDVDTIWVCKLNRAIVDSDLRPLVKDTFESILTLPVTPLAKSYARTRGIYGEGEYKAYILDPEDKSFILVMEFLMGTFTIYHDADSILYERDIIKNGRVIHSIGFIKSEKYGRQDHYKGEAIDVTAMGISDKNRALADSILDNVEFITRKHD